MQTHLGTDLPVMVPGDLPGPGIERAIPGERTAIQDADFVVTVKGAYHAQGDF
ncbi:MAG: hypothetical protein RQ715_08610 [Methylococcales bacterium]|nr:hypothetical protein [Methylococcales bacterium]